MIPKNTIYGQWQEPPHPQCRVRPHSTYGHDWPGRHNHTPLATQLSERNYSEYLVTNTTLTEVAAKEKYILSPAPPSLCHTYKHTYTH